MSAAINSKKSFRSKCSCNCDKTRLFKESENIYDLFFKKLIEFKKNWIIFCFMVSLHFVFLVPQESKTKKLPICILLEHPVLSSLQDEKSKDWSLMIRSPDVDSQSSSLETPLKTTSFNSFVTISVSFYVKRIFTQEKSSILLLLLWIRILTGRKGQNCYQILHINFQIEISANLRDWICVSRVQSLSIY